MRRRLAFAMSLLSLLLALPACSSSQAGTASASTLSPSATVHVAATVTASTIASGPTGSVSGSELMYPADSMPALAIYATSTSDSQRYFFVVTRAGELSYSISGVAPGAYYVIAYLANPPSGNFKALVGGYTHEVACALSGATDCNDHTLIPVTVQPGGAVKDINPNDYYGGTFPPRPGA